MEDFIYIGEKTENINKFSNLSDVVFSVVPDCTKAIKTIDSIQDKLDIAVFFEQRDLIIDLSNIQTLRKNYPGVYFVLVSDNLSPQDSLTYLKNGVNNAISLKDPAVIKHVIDFLKVRKDACIKDFSEKKAHTRLEFHLPFWKRLCDIFFASLILICLSPIFLLAVLAITLGSKGPIIYKSKRVGGNYKIFDCLKFRSMYTNTDNCIKNYADRNTYNDFNEDKDICNSTLDVIISDDNVDKLISNAMISDDNADQLSHDEKYLESMKISDDAATTSEDIVTGTALYADDYIVGQKQYSTNRDKEISHPFIKMKNDPRVTKVGYILRKFNIDELPQFINIIKGDMSIVGNCPLPLYEAELLTNDEYIERFIAPAGLLGLWQVENREKKGMTTAEERRQWDIQYAKLFSFQLDVKIIWRSFKVLFH
jgi:lipopolysaccharide/colanic/teichoic acid biosynthesis glycosyltransferase